MIFCLKKFPDEAYIDSADFACFAFASWAPEVLDLWFLFLLGMVCEAWDVVIRVEALSFQVNIQ